MEKTVKIKGMVCRRCIDTVRKIFERQQLQVSKVELGQITYQTDTDINMQEIEHLLQAEGFEILTDRQSAIIHKIKALADKQLAEDNHIKNFAALVASTLHMDYDSASALFTATEGITLEQYMIQKRIEKVQELLKYTDMSLTDIAFQLGYSSVHHLSNQFKKISGMPPSVFRELKSDNNQD